MEQELDLFYLPHAQGRPQEEEEEVELTDRDMVVAYYDGDRLDLGEMVREQIFLACRCKRAVPRGLPGLCPSCGAEPQPGAVRVPAARRAPSDPATSPPLQQAVRQG